MLFAAVIAVPAVLLTVLVTGSAIPLPSVATDKAQYGPDDLVTITGLDFLPSQALDVVVVTPDGFIFTGDGTGTPGFDSVVASPTGGFTYLYQLASYGAGHYTIEVYDSGDVSHLTLLATQTFYDDTPVPATVSAAYDPGTGELTVSGTYSWPSCPNSGKAAGFAIFIDGATPIVPGSGALDGIGVVNTMHPINMTSYVFPCVATGSFGPDTHVLGSAPTSVCVVTYDIHLGDLPPATGKHSTVGAGSNRNTDNSYERAGISKPKNAYGTPDCTTAATPTPSPSPTPAPTANFTVLKDFSDKPGTDTTTVSVTLSCASGAVDAPNPTTASEFNPAVFTVTGFTGDPNCTATEAPIPTGYTSGGTCVAALVAGGQCTITNTLNSALFTVNKDFVPDDAAIVSVTLTCDDGTIVSANPQNVSEGSPGVWTVTGIDGSAGCTASESPVPTGHTASGCDVAVNLPENGANSCTITNTLRTATITVIKDFIPDSAASVSVTLVCTSGSIVAPNPKSATEAAPAVFTVDGFNAGATCTATEGVPAGYTANQLDCVSKLIVDGGNVSCTITNTLNSATFTVNKDFIPDSAASVSVTLVCDDGTIATPNPTSATEAAPAVWTVTGITGSANCTASESPVPAGHTASGCTTSVNLPENGANSCTITNTERTGSVTVNKDFLPNSAASVSVTLVCSSGSIVAPNPTSATEAAPAVFTVTGFNAGATCTATEAVPAGYLADESDCVSKLLVDGGNVSCTITNSLNPAIFTVNKDFLPNSGASVSVTLSCSSGTIAFPNPTNATEAAPAFFIVNGFSAGATCTATEAVPAGYVADESDCASKLLVAGGNVSCTITNTQRSGTVTVNKDFLPNSGASVSVTLSCTSGSIVAPNPKSATEALPAVFTVDGFNAGATCTATEAVPAGYVADESDCASKLLVDGGNVSCTITNTQRSGTVTVNKDFIPDDAASVSVTLVCSSGSISGPNPTTATETTPAVFTVDGFNAGATCTATEGVPTGYTANQLDCVSKLLVDGGNVSCTITNTLNSATFTVNKDFIPDSAASVSVTLVCDDGTIAPPTTRSATEAVPAVWTVTGITGSANCTASESPVPAGHTASGCTASVILPENGANSCTITNSGTSAIFTVNKDFIPDNAASVSVTLVCDDGTIAAPNPTSATEAAPAVFTVNGITGSANCTASESPVPAGHTASGCTTSVILPENGANSCTIINTQRTGTVTVNKDFLPDSLASVSVTLVCSSGSIVTTNPTSATEALPAVFTVKGFDAGATCTATEAVPAGYTASQLACASKLLVDGGDVSCTITNTERSGTVTVNKDFVPDSAASVSVTLSCTSGSIVTTNPTNATEALPAVFTVNGFGPGATCSATEATPAGYVADESDCVSKLLVDGGDVSCTITNTERNGTVTVNKDFVPDNAASVSVTLVCSSGSIVAPNPTNATEASPAVFTVKGFDAGATCMATEATPAGYVADDSDCVSKLLVDAGNVSCTITNTLNPATFKVTKTFSDNNPAEVSITLSCTSGTISPTSTEPTVGQVVTFTIVSFTDPGTTCSASESGVPLGYDTDNSACQNLAISDGAETSCTITNTPTVIPPPTATFTVHKDFTDKPSTDMTTVTVTLACASGTVAVPNPQSASEFVPAVFTVTGFTGDPNCTATEAPIPAGYTSTGTCVAALVAVSQCTITNTLVTTANFNVLKDFSDDNTNSVTVGLTCTSGTVTTIDATASEADDANFTVTGFVDPGTTCTATEGTAPLDYSKNETACLAVVISDSNTSSCTIVNTLTPVGGLVEIFVPGTTGDDSGIGVALFGLIFIAAIALLSAGVATVRVTRRVH